MCVIPQLNDLDLKDRYNSNLFKGINKFRE